MNLLFFETHSHGNLELLPLLIATLTLGVSIYLFWPIQGGAESFASCEEVEKAAEDKN